MYPSTKARTRSEIWTDHGTQQCCHAPGNSPCNHRDQKVWPLGLSDRAPQLAKKADHFGQRGRALRRAPQCERCRMATALRLTCRSRPGKQKTFRQIYPAPAKTATFRWPARRPNDQLSFAVPWLRFVRCRRNDIDPQPEFSADLAGFTKTSGFECDGRFAVDVDRSVATDEVTCLSQCR
jgi:hypothetical protein